MDIQQLKEKGRQLGFLASVSSLVGMGCTTFLMARVGEDFDPSELMSVGFGSAFVMVFGGYAFFRHRQGLEAQLVSHGFSIRSIFKWSVEEDENPDWVEVIASTYKPGRRKYDLPIGVNEYGNLVEVPMKNAEAHLIFSGNTGSGKSVLVNQTILAAAMSGLYQVVIVSLSKKDYQLLDHMQNVHVISFDDESPDSLAEKVAAYSDALLTTLNDFNNEVTRRQQIVTKYGVRDLHDVRADQRPPAVLLVLEEFTNAIEFAGFGKPKRQISQAREAILSATKIAINFGRSSMMHLALIGQRPSGVIPNVIRKQSVNITTKVDNARESSYATGRKNAGAENLRPFNPVSKEPGQALIVGSLTNETVEIPFTPDEVITELSHIHEDEVRFTGYPNWASAYQNPTQDEITVTIPLSQKESVTTGAGVIQSEISSPYADRAHKRPKSTSPVVSPSKNRLSTDAVIQIFAAQYNKADHEPSSPTQDQFIALGLFAAAGLPYKQLGGPAVFNGSHGNHFDSGDYSHKLVKMLEKQFDIRPLMNELRHLTKFYYQGFDLVDTPDALSKARWVGLALCIHSQLGQNQSVRAIFGSKNGRYVDYFKKAQEFYSLYQLTLRAA